MKFVGVFLVVVAVCIAKCSGLFCHTCLHKDQKRCAAASFLPSEDCPEMQPNEKAMGLTPVCALIIYNYPNKTKSVDRGCRTNLSRGTDFCADLKIKDETTECFICERDLCNGAIRNLAKLGMLLTSFIVVMSIKQRHFIA